MTALVLILAIIALLCAIGVSRQVIRTLCAWQKAMDAMVGELRGRQGPAPDPTCPCTCHPLPSTRRPS